MEEQNQDLNRALRLLREQNCTCVLCRGEDCFTSTARGVAPLLAWLDQGTDLTGCSAADKVVGRGAAFLYVLLGVRAVHGQVMSRCAAQVLEAHGVAVRWDRCPERILNRDRTGCCPIETSVLGLEDPLEALQAIRRRLEALAAGRPQGPSA